MNEPAISVLRDVYPEVFFFIDREECALGYSPKVREFYLRVRHTGSVVQTLAFCPFSGKGFPPSLRERFFDELEALCLYDLADADRAPTEFQSETWWIERGL